MSCPWGYLPTAVQFEEATRDQIFKLVEEYRVSPSPSLSTYELRAMAKELWGLDEYWEEVAEGEEEEYWEQVAKEEELKRQESHAAVSLAGEATAPPVSSPASEVPLSIKKPLCR